MIINEISYPREEIKQRLEKLGNLEGRSAAWVCADLSIIPSTWLGRCLWRLIAQYAQNLLSFFYSVDLEKSRTCLEQIKKAIAHDFELTQLHRKAVRRFNQLFPKHHLNWLPAVSTLVTGYNAAWDEDLQRYDIAADPARVTAVLKKSLKEQKQKIASLGVETDQKKYFGFIMKKDLPQGSILFVRADLHADLRSLLSNINALKNAGHLDENYRCQPGFHMIFLGDYLDRGSYDLQLLELLAALRLENPDQVYLLKGNHEDLAINMAFPRSIQVREYLFTHNVTMESFYDTLPLTLYVSEKREEGKRHYLHFTHGLFELKTDPIDLLDDPKEEAAMNIVRDQDFSARIRQIDLCVLQDNSTKKTRRAGKLADAAWRIQELAETERDRAVSTYNWGDVAAMRSYLGDLHHRNWKLLPIDIKHYMRLCEGRASKVKMIIRGHEHLHEHFLHYKYLDKILITTLTVGMDSLPNFHQLYKNQPDRAYILYTAPKVKDWEKKALLRQPGKSLTILTNKIPITSDQV